MFLTLFIQPTRHSNFILSNPNTVICFEENKYDLFKDNRFDQSIFTSKHKDVKPNNFNDHRKPSHNANKVTKIHDNVTFSVMILSGLINASQNHI